MLELNLKVLGRAGIGVDNIDIKTATDKTSCYEYSLRKLYNNGRTYY